MSPPDVQVLQDQLDAICGDAEALVAGLSERAGTWHSEADCWSVAECMDHLAITNRVYLDAMNEPSLRAREKGTLRQRPAVPGFVGRWFVKSLEPPVRAHFKMKAPRKITPRDTPSVADAFARFRASHDEVRAFVCSQADLDLATIQFPNPFVRGVSLSLATGLHVIAAHDRRHLWQAWRVRRSAEKAAKNGPAEGSKELRANTV